MALRSEQGWQHDAGVINQHVSAAQLGHDAVGGHGWAGTVSDIRLDGDRAVAKLAGQDVDAATAPREQWAACLSWAGAPAAVLPDP